MAPLVRLFVLAGLFLFARSQCPQKSERLRKPKFATEHNGVTWPQGCIDAEEANFYVIGDWGGEEFLGKVGPFQWKKRDSTNDIDKKPQHLVAARMKEHAVEKPPEFVINVGDNFYPAGVKSTCDSVFPWIDLKFNGQFRHVFERMYDGRDLKGKEWLGVLGNHDYGGHKYDQGWVHNIYYTWSHSRQNRWLTPAQYWMRTYQFNGFTADFFFLDTNVANAMFPTNTESMCSEKHSKVSCTRNNPEGPSDPMDCFKYFQRLWAEEKAWLENKLAASTARWQIIVMHHPPYTYEAFFNEMCVKYGVDLMITGHIHIQDVRYKQPPFGDTALIISGGGGGILSEGLPNLGGVDGQYGFMDLTINQHTITINAHSHGGEEGKKIIMSTTVVTPRARSGQTMLQENSTNWFGGSVEDSLLTV